MVKGYHSLTPRELKGVIVSAVAIVSPSLPQVPASIQGGEIYPGCGGALAAEGW